MNATLLIILFVCHYLADYSHLSTDYMLSAKRIGKPFYPIFLHALIHMALMAIPLSFLGLKPATLMNILLMQLFSHFIIDVLKGRCNVWFPKVSKPQNNSHWYVFGFDQLLHQLVIITMCLMAH